MDADLVSAAFGSIFLCAVRRNTRRTPDATPASTVTSPTTSLVTPSLTTTPVHAVVPSTPTTSAAPTWRPSADSDTASDASTSPSSSCIELPSVSPPPRTLPTSPVPYERSDDASPSPSPPPAPVPMPVATAGRRIGKDAKKRFRCDTCGKTFGKKNHVARHVQAVHLNVRPYVCGVCRFPFQEKRGLQRHLKVHEKQQQVGLVPHTQQHHHHHGVAFSGGVYPPQ